MNRSNTLQNDTTTLNKRLARKFFSSRRYNPIFLAVTGIGFITIHLLTQFSILGAPAPQLLYIGGITLVFSIAEIPMLALAQQNHGTIVVLLGSALAGIFAILLTLFWRGIVPFTILITLATPYAVLRRGMTRNYSLALLLIVAVILSGIFAVDRYSPLDRLQNNTPAAIASIIFLVSTGLLLFTITNISHNRKFQSIQGLLLTSFIIIVTVPIVMTVALSAIGAYTNSQTQTFNSLHAITALKENEIENFLDDVHEKAKGILDDARFRANTLEALATAEKSSAVGENLKASARTRLADFLGAEGEGYKEIMVLDHRGEVLISTTTEREGTSFESQAFFRQGISKFHAGFAEEPLFGTDNLIATTPIIAQDGQSVSGVLVLRSTTSTLKNIMESTRGFIEAETYLVDMSFKPVTSTRIETEHVRTRAVNEVISGNTLEGKAIYTNYAGQQVLGYYEWFRPMGLAVIAEVPTDYVVDSSLRAMAGSSFLALFIAAIAIAAVVVSARTIANPIKTLAGTAEKFAEGNLSVRAEVDRQDEIGALARGYNQMATQIQEMIIKLEQRVADRTRDLEEQSLRLRLAAEIARDATSARDLSELLARAGELIRKRFTFYHIGIFLLDNKREFAVMVSSPTEAGRKMIEEHYRVRVGDADVVARVSATGSPRIAPDTHANIPILDNPYLPDTHSEMALPLRVENTVIGVLDVQSDQPEAFDEDDMATMQVLADQLATAIERTRLLQEVERSLKELESAYGRFTRENWQKLTDGMTTGNPGYRFDSVRLLPLTEVPEGAEESIRKGRVIHSIGKTSGAIKEDRVHIPIKLRGQTIGVVSLKLKEGFDQDTIPIVELAAERLAAALESARLYEEARVRADREHSISRVTTAISASIGYEQILQTTVREIGNLLEDAEVAIRVVDESTMGKPASEPGER